MALVCLGTLGVLGGAELALYFAPLLLLGALLVSGRFVGEELILARRTSRSPAPRRAPRSMPRQASSHALASLLTRRAHSERGPPAVVALTA